MEVNELRVGNWVAYKSGTPVQIESVGDYGWFNLLKTGCGEPGGGFDVETESLSDVQPILLTEDILVKCGFIKRDKFFVTEDLGFFFNDGGAYITGASKPVMYLHDLQNTYFALTGKELDVKL